MLLSLEFSRTLLLIGEFFFAGALGREVAAKRAWSFWMRKRRCAVPRPRTQAGRQDGGPVRIEFADVTFTYPGAE